MSSNRTDHSRGFSLVELSIVLVILGLLVGGVLSGQALIRAAELRSLTAEYSKYVTAQNTFRDKYFAIPGDITNATAFWGVRAGSGADNTCYTTINTATGTCNGNGDGFTTDNGASSSSCPEQFLYWQHLGNAGMIEGKFSGATISVGNCWQTPGLNVPASKLSNAMWLVGTLASPMSGNSEFYDGGYGYNILHPVLNASGTSAGNQLITPAEAWNLDTKTDDGKPATGSMFVLKSTSSGMPGCTTTDVASTAQYALSSSSKICAPYIVLR